MSGFLDFKDISAKVPFKMLLDHYGLAYSESGGTWKGATEKFNFVIDPDKNIFLDPKNPKIKGGVINFCSFYEGLDLRKSAKLLQDWFIDEPKAKELPELKLEYSEFLEKRGYSEEFCEKLCVGLYKGRGIMSGKITAKCVDMEGNKTGYVGYDPKKDKWFFPKGFRRPLYNAENVGTDYCILVPDLFGTLHLLQYFPFVTGLLGASMTDSQESIIATKFQRVLLIHPNGENVRNRLSKHCFVKWIEPDKAIEQLTKEDVKSFF